MAKFAQGQFTIVDLSDPIISGSEPGDKVVDMLWLDTTKNPHQLKRWDGKSWVVVSDPDIAEDVEQIIKRIDNVEVEIGTEGIIAKVEKGTTTLAKKEYVDENFTSKTYTETTLATKSEVAVLEGQINLKVEKEEYQAKVDEINEELISFDGRLNQAEIDLQPENITITVEETTTKLANKDDLSSSEDKALEELKSKVSQISVSLDAINQKVEKTENGSKNYIKNSGNFKNTDNWTGNISVNESDLYVTGSAKNCTDIQLEKNSYYVFSATVKFKSDFTLTENNFLNFSITKTPKSTVKSSPHSFKSIEEPKGFDMDELNSSNELVVQILGDSFNMIEGSPFELDFKSNKVLDDIELSITDGEEYEYIGVVEGEKVSFPTENLKNGLYICNIKATTSEDVFITQSFIVRVNSLIKSDDNFSEIEIIGTRFAPANEYTRLSIRFKTKDDFKSFVVNPVLNSQGSAGYYIKNVQLEKGSVPSDWVDDNEIDELRKQVAELFVGINEINASVSNIQSLTNKLGNIEERVQIAEQKITSTAISNTVKETVSIGSSNFIKNSGKFSDKTHWQGDIEMLGGEFSCNGEISNLTNIPIKRGEDYVLSATIKLPENFTMTENNLLDYIVIQTLGGEIDG